MDVAVELIQHVVFAEGQDEDFRSIPQSFGKKKKKHGLRMHDTVVAGRPLILNKHKIPLAFHTMASVADV